MEKIIVNTVCYCLTIRHKYKLKRFRIIFGFDNLKITLAKDIVVFVVHNMSSALVETTNDSSYSCLIIFFYNSFTSYIV